MFRLTRLNWGNEASHFYSSGIDRGVLYSSKGLGVAWNGLISIAETPSDYDTSVGYIDGLKYRHRIRSESFSAKLEAFTYPDEFLMHDGTYDRLATRQRRSPFGLCYRTSTGLSSDVAIGYKIHLIYNALAQPTESLYETNNDSASPSTFNWEITTTPIAVQGVKASAHLIIDTSKAHAETITALENLLYGDVNGAATMPTPESIFELFDANSIFVVTDHGDGTFTATGPSESIRMIDDTTFEITWDSAIMIDEIRYTLSSG